MTTSGGTTNNVPLSNPVAEGDLLFACFFTSGNVFNSISDNQNNDWQFACETTTELAGYFQVWYAANCKAGSTTISTKWNSSQYTQVVVGEYSGVALSSPLDQTAVGINTGGGPLANAGGLVTTKNNEILIAFIFDDAGDAGPPGHGWTLRFSLVGETSNLADQPAATAGAYATQATIADSGPWAMLVASFFSALSADGFWYGSN